MLENFRANVLKSENSSLQVTICVSKTRVLKFPIMCTGKVYRQMLLPVCVFCQTLVIASSHVTLFFTINVRFLGSVEVNGFKGNEIICDAMKEVQYKSLQLD